MFIFSQTSLNPGSPKFISRLNFSKCREETYSLLSDRCDVETIKKLTVKMLASELAQANQPCPSEEISPRLTDESLKALNACLLHDVQMVKAYTT